MGEGGRGEDTSGEYRWGVYTDWTSGDDSGASGVFPNVDDKSLMEGADGTLGEAEDCRTWKINEVPR